MDKNDITLNYAFQEYIPEKDLENKGIKDVAPVLTYEEPRWTFKNTSEAMNIIKESDASLYEKIQDYVKEQHLPSENTLYLDFGKSLRYDDEYMGDFSKETLEDKLDNLFIVRYSHDNDDGNLIDGGDEIVINDNETVSLLNGMIEEHVKENIKKYEEYKIKKNSLQKNQTWIWKDYDDLSGHLEAPDGTQYFSYDWTTKEYKVNPDKESWDSFLDADPTRDTSLSAFKDYAQNYIKNNIVKDKSLNIVFERNYIDTEKLMEEEEKKMTENETLADKYNRIEKLFEGKTCRLGNGEPQVFKELYDWVQEEFPEKDSEGVLFEATSRMIEENLDFGEFNYQAFDDVYGFGGGAEWRLDFSDSAAKKLISGEILTLSDAQSLIWEKAENEFAALKENPQYKDEIEITDRINSAFRIADFLYPEFTKEIDKEKNLLADEWPQYSNEEKKTVINNAFEKIKSAFDEKKVRLSDSRTDELVFEGSDKWLLLGDFKALIKGKDAAEHGKESLSYIRPNAEQFHDGIENGWEFDEITTGYAIFQNQDLDVKGGFTPKFISKINDMNVFESDGDAGKQYGIDNNCRILEEKKDIWIGDEDLEYYSYPDIPENRRIMKENGWLLEQPLEFDFSEFTEKDFNRIRDELFKDNPKEDYYGRLHIGSLHVEFVINQNDGWVDTNYYILGEKGEGETQFGVPYGHFPGHQFIANLFTDNTYEEFKEKVTKAVLDDIAEEGTLKPEAMRPLVDWNDEQQCNELYHTKLVESARVNEIVIAPYSREERDVEAVRDFVSKIVNLPVLGVPDDMVFAVLDNIGRVQDENPGDFLKIRKDGSVEHISALGPVEKEPVEVLHIINSFAEDHASVSEEGSQQRKDYEEINSLSKKAYEKHMRINESGFNPSEYVLNELKEKGIEVVFDKEEFDRILLRENNLQKMSEKLTEAQRRRYFTFDEEDTKKFEEHIKEWQKYNTNPSKLIVVGKTTPVMKILGISEKLIEVEQSTLDKMIRDVPVYPNDKQGHKLSVDDIYAIPSQLADPVMVFKSRTRNDSFVFFTERKDSGNHSILIPLAVDKRKGRIVIHEITSMYGKDNEIDFVKTNIDENNLVYEDRKRSCLWAKEKIEELEKQNIEDAEKNKSSNGGRFTQIQFLGQRFTDNGTYTFNILTKERLVNFISANSKKRTPVQKMALASEEPENIESLFVSKNEENLDSEIDKLTEKDVSLKDDFITISEKTPFIFKEFGLDDFPVNMYKQKLARALFLEEEKFGERRTHGHKGEFTEQEVKDVFKNISNPRYIFNSKQDLNNPDNFYLVGVYDVMDKRGNPMVLSFHFDKNRRQVEANWVTSVYGKRINTLVNDWVKKGYLVYENDIEMEKASEEVVALHMRVSNLQRPYRNSIKRKSDYVNDMDLLFSKRNENVYGFTYEGKIYLNPDVLGAESAVHEYTHLWDNLTRKDNPELWNKGLKIFKGTSLWNEVINDSHYQDIKDDENLVLSECHARICGRVADSVLNHIAELDGNEKQAEMIDWDKETIDFIFENYRDVFAGSTFNSVAEFTASAMKTLFSPLTEIKKEIPNIETLSFIKEVLEKESGIRVDEKIAGEIYSRYQDHDLNLKLEYYPNGTFRAYDYEDGKYTNPFKIGDAVEKVLSWNEKELSELHAGTADDKEIAEIKKINGELEHICGQIACNGRLEVLDSDDEKSVGKVKKFLEDDGFKVERSEAKTLLAFASDFHDGTSDYAVNDNNQLYFRTSNDNEGWSFISENDHEYGYEIIVNAFEHALNLLDASHKDHVQSFSSFVQKNREILSDNNHSDGQSDSVKAFMQRLESLKMPEKRITVTHSVTFPCGFTFPKEIYENDPGENKREEYRWKIYEKIKEKFGFHDNDTETEYFKGNIPSESSFNIHFAVSVPTNIKTDAEKVDAWIKDVEKFVKEECGCTFINWQGGERHEQTFVNEKQYKMQQERNNDFAHPNAEDLDYASPKDIKEYCKLNSEIELSDKQLEEIHNFYDNNDQFALYVSPAGNLYVRDEYDGNLISADSELLKAGNYLRTLEGKERLEYLLKNTSIDEPEWSKGLLNQASNDSDERLRIVSDVLSDSFATLDRHDGFWQLLLDYGADPTRAIRIAAEDANLGDNLNWLLSNVPESHLNQIFSDNGYADAVFDIAKKSVEHDMDSWHGGEDIGFEVFKRIARLCEREADADRYYGELLEKAFEYPVEPKIVQLLDTPELLAEKMNNSKVHPNEPSISRDQASSILDYCNYENIKFYVAKDGGIYSLDVSEDYNGEGMAESNFGIVANGIEYARKAHDLEYPCYSTESFSIVEELWQKERQFANPSVENTIKTFTDDIDKMRDFDGLSKEDFLASYDYISEKEYDAIANELKEHGRTGLQTVKALAYKNVMDKNYLAYDNRLEKSGSKADKIQSAIERLTDVSLPAVAGEIGKSEQEVAEIISALLDAKDYVEERFNVVRPTADEIIEKVRDEVSWADILKTELSWKELGLNPEDYDRTESGTETEKDFKEWAMGLELENTLDLHGFDTALEGVSSWNNSTISEQKWMIIDKLSEEIVSGKLKIENSQDAFDKLLKENEVYKDFVQKGIVKDDAFGLREITEKELKSVSAKEPVDIIKEIATQKELAEVPELFTREFKYRMKTRFPGPEKDPFIVAKAIINDWKTSKPDYIPALNKWLSDSLKKEGFSTKEDLEKGFEKFFKKLSSPEQKHMQHKDSDIGQGR